MLQELQEVDAATFREFSSHNWHIGVVSSLSKYCQYYLLSILMFLNTPLLQYILTIRLRDAADLTVP